MSPERTTSDKPRVLHVISGLTVGGAERALYNLVTGGLAEHFDTRVISLTGPGRYGPWLRQAGIEVETLNAGLTNPAWLPRLLRSARQFRPDLIQGWMYHGNLAASLAALAVRGRVPVVWNVRHSLYDIGNERPGMRGVIRMNRLWARQPARILYNSAVSKDLHEAFGFPADRGQVIPNGFELGKWRFDPERRREVRQRLGLRDEWPVIGHFARFAAMKDHAGFLEAVGTVLEQMPETRVVMAGTDVDRNNPAFEALVRHLSRDRILALGERDDIEDLMLALDVYCLSSAWGEAFPNVLGEAMSCGVPCVTTKVGDAESIVQGSGWAVPVQDPPHLAEALLTALQLDAGERERAGARARERIEQNFGLPAIVDDYARLYHSLSAHG